MIPFKKILVPTDFSECANAALDQALALQLPADGELTLLHVYQMPPIYPTGPVMTAEIIKATEDAARAALLKLKDRADGKLRAQGTTTVPRVTTKLAMGSARDEIIQEAKEGRYDLIVISTNGRSGWAHLMLGSVTERVVRAAPCPVLTVGAPGADASKR